MNKTITHNGMTIHFDVPVFKAYIKGNGGFLCPHQACHGLMYYGLLARNAYELNVQKKGLQYEGTVDNETNFRNLITSVSVLYGVTPEDMVKHWDEVDAQFILMGLPQVPKEERYRFDSKIVIITRH